MNIVLLSVVFIGIVLAGIGAFVAIGLIPVYLPTHGATSNQNTDTDTNNKLETSSFYMEYNVNNGTLSTGDIATNQRTSIYQQLIGIAHSNVKLNITAATVKNTASKGMIFRRQTASSITLHINGTISSTSACSSTCFTDVIKKFNSSLCTLHLSVPQ